jgi:hypothetical protein
MKVQVKVADTGVPDVPKEVSQDIKKSAPSLKARSPKKKKKKR